MRETRDIVKPSPHLIERFRCAKIHSVVMFTYEKKSRFTYIKDMTSFLDEAGIMNMLPRPNIATQAPTLAPTRAPTLAPTRAPISPQLTTAANLTKTPAPTTKTYIVPVATPGPITSTPAPLPTYQGPQDDLLFDPDPLEGDAAAGAGYALPGTAMINGPTSTLYTSAPSSNVAGTGSGGAVVTSAPAAGLMNVIPTTIDLADGDMMDEEGGGGSGNSRSIWTFVVIVALLIALILAVFAFYGMPGSSGSGGGGGGASGMGADPFGGLSTGGISSGLGSSGLGGLGGGRY
jgi:hypothetical protein